MSMAVVYERAKIVRKARIAVLTPGFDALGRFSQVSGFGVQTITIDLKNIEDCRAGHHFAVPKVPTQCISRSFEEVRQP